MVSPAPGQSFGAAQVAQRLNPEHPRAASATAATQNQFQWPPAHRLE